MRPRFVDSSPLGLTRHLSRFAHFRPEDLVGRSAAEFCHPDDVAATVALRAAPTGEVGPVTRRLRRADGTYTWVESVARVALDADAD